MMMKMLKGLEEGGEDLGKTWVLDASKQGKVLGLMDTIRQQRLLVLPFQNYLAESLKEEECRSRTC